MKIITQNIKKHEDVKRKYNKVRLQVLREILKNILSIVPI